MIHEGAVLRGPAGILTSTLAVLSLIIPSTHAQSFVEVTVRPQSRSQTIPVAVSLQQKLPEPPRGRRWQLQDGRGVIDAQAAGGGRMLVFLLPVESSRRPIVRRLKLVQAPVLSQASVTMEESEGRAIDLYESGVRILSYNSGMVLKPGVPEDRRRSSYVHPICAPDGTELTDDFPADHLHHRGLSWMWPNVEIGGASHSLWDIRGISQRFERLVDQTAGPVGGALTVANGWYTAERRVAREQVEMVVYRALPAGRAIDIALTFEALEQPIRITGETGPERKGYGGLCLRFAPRDTTVITAGKDVRQGDSNLMPFPWADLSGRFSATGRVAGAAVFIHPRNPAAPNGWTLRHYGFLGVAWPGLQPVVLEPGVPVTLRYRLWLHAKQPDLDALEAQYQAYADPPQARIAAD